MKSQIKKIIGFTAFFLLVCPALVSAQTYTRIIPSNIHIKPPGSVQETDFFPVSVWYSGGKARAPLISAVKPKSKQQWLKDLRQIKSLGFNTVRTWVSWSHAEPKEGQYHFNHLKLLLKLAHQVGLKVIIQMYIDSAPEWVGKKFGKDALFETQNGHRIIPQGAPGYSIDDPGVRKTVWKLYRKTAKIAIQYPNFFGWDIWSEPHIINWIIRPWVKRAQFGFNPYTQSRFRQWLKRKYHTLDKLNKAWGRHFLSWDDVTAPRYSTILSYTDFIDWKLFLYHKIAMDMRFKYNAIRSVDSSHVITAHASPPSILASPMSGKDASNDFQRAQQLDYYGLSMYPKHGNHSGNWPTWLLELEPDFSYSANVQHGGFYVGELQAGQGTTIGLSIGDPITSNDEREWIWTAIAAGAKAINIYAYYPMTSGYESGGYGLINLDGSLTERAKTDGKIAKLITQNSKLFVNSKPVKAQIALVYNPLSQMIGGYSGGAAARLHTQSLIGYYRYFNAHNIPVAFIDRRDLTKKDLSQYKLIIAPSSLIFTKQAAHGLINYVKKGGHLVGEARFGWNNIKGYASRIIPGMGLGKLFGVKEAKIGKRKKIVMKISDANSALTKGFNKGDSLIASFFAESMKRLPDVNHKVQVLADFKDGSPAMTVTRYGKGGALYIGSFMGYARQELPDASKKDDPFLHNLLQWAGVQFPFTTPGINGEEVEVRLQKNQHDNGYLLFIINHQKTKQTVSVHLNLKNLELSGAKEIKLKELTSGPELGGSGNIFQLQIHLPAKGVEVWHVQAE